MRAASFDGAITFAQDLIRIPSLPGEEGELARRVVTEMEALGYDEVRTDELGSVIGVVRGGGEGGTVMLSAHLDMVSAGDPDEWEHPPFDGVVAGGYLHGRGAMDIKGPLALQVHAAAALRGRVAGDIIVAHPVYEERGGWGMDHLVRPDGGLSPDVVIIGESTHGDIAIGHRGRTEVEIVAHGLAGHASAPDRARNALDLLPAILAGVRDLAARQGSDAVLGPSSVVATGVGAVPASLNVIPDRVTVTLDWRILPEDTGESLVARVRQSLQPHLDRAGKATWAGAADSVQVRIATETQRTYTGVEAARRMFSPGFLMDPSDPIVTAAARAVGTRGDSDAPARVRPWTFATDGGWTRGVRGIPTIGFAPGEERHAHTNTERLDLEEARWGYAKHLDLVPAVQGAVNAGSAR
ncbi:MAG: M20/M25/M40 family metallo-hydrolase [Gemmatimonadota bacterium]|nr:M20/M25/M40 family metallo-hydrolase [Gemmatimonadota bacterium]MDE2871274.1 M20/M25/M40 family metallo-hydrolase [Gemmatimonadota bacterium]